MASFNITINAEPNIPFMATYNKLRQGDCLSGVTEVPLGIVDDTNTPGINFLLSEYTGALGWKTINISNISYSQPTWFDLEYNSGILTPNVDPDVVVQAIPVTGILTNAAIPLFFANYNNTLATGNASIQFDLEIIDTNDVSLGKIRAGVLFTYVECLPPAVKAKIIENSLLDNVCQTTRVVTVQVPPEGSRYVYKVESDGFSTVSGTLPATITVDTQYTLSVDANNSGPNAFYSTCQLHVKESSSSGTTIASATVSRNHTGNIC